MMRLKFNTMKIKYALKQMRIVVFDRCANLVDINCAHKHTHTLIVANITTDKSP